MAKRRIDTNIRCPSCGGMLYPRVLACDSCGLKVEGDFVTNEFGALTPDELHFLRVFIYTEGRIRDMEAALGVSYPTVKGHLASIKAKLNLTRERTSEVAAPGAPMGPTGPAAPAAPDAPEVAPPGPEDPHAILDKIESGAIDPTEGVKLLKSRRRGTPTP
jgi:hypothetical protein